MDLVATARTKLLTALQSTAAHGQAVLLTDEDMLHILSACVRMSELLEAAPHITLVESLKADLEVRAPSSLAVG